jgi:hypothetical protein
MPIERVILTAGASSSIIGANKDLMWGQDICSVDSDLENIARSIKLLKNAPFPLIHGSTIFQLRNLDCFGTITIGRINKKYGWIESYIYPDYRVFHASFLSRKVLLDFYKIFSLHEIIAVGKKYNLQTQIFEEMLSKMGSIPKWTEEMGEPILDPEKEGSTWNDKWMQNPQLVIDLYNESIGVDTSNDDRYLKYFIPSKNKKIFKNKQTSTRTKDTFAVRWYKKTNEKLLYFEAWLANPQEALVHYGEVGSTGVVKEIINENGAELKAQLGEVIDKYKKEGYKSRKFCALCIEYEISDNFGNEDEIAKCQRLKDCMNEFLGWNGLGFCDGSSSGEGVMEICCYVIDYDTAERLIKQKLDSSEFSNYSRIYKE